MTNNQIFWLWVLGFPAAGIIVGVAGLRIAALRYVLAAAAPVYSGALFVYGLFRGGPNDCVDSPQPPGYVCHPTSFMSDIGWYGVVIVSVATVISLSPLGAAAMRNRVPSIIGAVLLVVLIGLFPFGLLLWVPAASAVIAAAIAGPPRPRARKAPADAVTVH